MMRLTLKAMGKCKRRKEVYFPGVIDLIVTIILYTAAQVQDGKR